MPAPERQLVDHSWQMTKWDREAVRTLTSSSTAFTNPGVIPDVDMVAKRPRMFITCATSAGTLFTICAKDCVLTVVSRYGMFSKASNISGFSGPSWKSNARPVLPSGDVPTLVMICVRRSVLSWKKLDVRLIRAGTEVDG